MTNKKMSPVEFLDLATTVAYETWRELSENWTHDREHQQSNFRKLAPEILASPASIHSAAQRGLADPWDLNSPHSFGTRFLNQLSRNLAEKLGAP